MTMRNNFLDSVSRYIDEEYRIYYQDENLILIILSFDKAWIDI